jgi:hypothetical protein
MSKKQPEHIGQAAERIREKIEAPVLSPVQARILDSGYINSADNVLALLEKTDQNKGAVFNGKLPPDENSRS